MKKWVSPRSWSLVFSDLSILKWNMSKRHSQVSVSSFCLWCYIFVNNKVYVKVTDSKLSLLRVTVNNGFCKLSLWLYMWYVTSVNVTSFTVNDKYIRKFCKPKMTKRHSNVTLLKCQSVVLDLKLSLTYLYYL